ncbi:MAG: DNA-3-methyladenine glycosylase [Candidatus Diapherotrites archaeon]|nr:DNA-3-methyladenine glycosylase [Candidatus Diapherotrites archaeon]
MALKLRKPFFERNSARVARELIGKTLVFGPCSGRIVETEAYFGETDPASHASRQVHRQKKAHPMYGPPGRAYVYLNYGLHWLLNAVTERNGTGGAVLIRAVEPQKGIRLMKKRRKTAQLHELCRGPGRLTQAFGISGKQNKYSLLRPPIYFLDVGEKPVVAVSKRIGITKGTEMNLRFFEKDSPFVFGFKRRGA